MKQVDLGVERFKSMMVQGLARPNKFAVELPALGPNAIVSQVAADVPPDDVIQQAGDHARMHPTGDVNLLCKSCTLPMRSILTNDRRIGMKSEKVSYGYSVQDVNFSFYETNDYKIRDYFEVWMSRQIDLDTNEIEFKKGRFGGYAKDVVIHQLDSNGNVVYSVVLEDAFPIGLAQIDLANDNNGTVEITITMTYTNWRSEKNYVSQRSKRKIVNINPMLAAVKKSTWINPDLRGSLKTSRTNGQKKPWKDPG